MTFWQPGLCDVATAAPHPRGRMYLWWAGDFYSSGHYLELEENKRVKFRWYSSIDPAPTEVTVTFAEKDGLASTNAATAIFADQDGVVDGTAVSELALKIFWHDGVEWRSVGGRVDAVDLANRRVTLTDSSGATHSLKVSAAVFTSSVFTVTVPLSPKFAEGAVEALTVTSPIFSAL